MKRAQALEQSRRREWRVGRPSRAGGLLLATISAIAVLLGMGAAAGLAAQDDLVLAALRGETGIDPEPGTLLATVSGLSIERAPLAEALVRLAERSRVQIAFSPSLLPPDLRVGCDCAELSLAGTLDRLLADTDLGYMELGSQVILVPKAGSDLAPFDGTVSGRVRSEVAIPVEGATVRLSLVADTTIQRVTDTDRLGFFAFHDVAPGAYALSVARIGYASHEEGVDVPPEADVQVEMTLTEQAIELEGVMAEARRGRQRARFDRSAGATVQEMSRQEVKMIPGVAEPDPVRAVETLPGVTQVSDFTAAFNVRGGSADQNLILLDGVPIFNPFHGLGVFSVFNPDALQWAELHSGGFPAQYGGRVSSVLLVESDLGDGELGVDAAVSLIASRATVKGGLPRRVTDRLGLASVRWQLSGRRSYLDLLTRPFLKAPFPYQLWSTQTGFEGWTKKGDRVRLTAYSGRDAINLRHADILGDGGDREDWDRIPERQWRWGNDAVGASWTRPLPGGGAWDLHGHFSRFQADFEFSQDGDVGAGTSISQLSFGADLERHPTPRTRWKSGLAIHRMEYENRLDHGVPDYPLLTGAGDGLGSAAYTQIHWSNGLRWLVEGGVRLDHWRPGGHRAITSISPRIAVKRFLRDRDLALKAAVGRYTQFVHTVRQELEPISLEPWVLSGNRAPVLASHQVQGGAEAFLGGDDAWYVSVEGYYRTYDGVVTVNWADSPSDPADDLLTGEGLAYGADLLFRRNRGRTTGWLSLSLLKTNRTFLDTASGLDPAPVIEYPPGFDRRLEIDLVLRRELPGNSEGGIRWNFGTGLPYTQPLAKYYIYRPQMIDQLVDPTFAHGIVFGPTNGARHPVHHRLDISLRKTWEKRWGRVTPYLNVINVYNRKNVFINHHTYYAGSTDGISMLPILPTIGVEVSF